MTVRGGSGRRWTLAWLAGAVIGVANGVLADCNVAKGRTWPFVLAWIALGPAVMRRRAALAAVDTSCLDA